MTNNSQEEIITLARTIYGEAANQSLRGMAAVAYVVRNRVLQARKNPRKGILFGDGTYRSACLKKWQFSCWLDNDPNSSKIKKLSFETQLTNKVFSNCVKIAQDVFEEKGNYPNEIKDSTHYYADYIDKPSWAKGLKPVIKIGRHIFFENVP